MGITPLLSYSGLDPRSPVLCRPPTQGRNGILAPLDKNMHDPPGYLSFIVSCSAPSATPGTEGVSRLLRPSLFGLRIFKHHRPFPFSVTFGANYRIQRLTLHLAISASLLASLLGLRCRVSVSGSFDCQPGS